MIGDAIKTILASVTANVTPMHIPRNRGSKWCVYTIISNVPHNTKDGASTYDQYRLQVDCYDTQYDRMDTFAASVRSALDEYSGTSEGVVIDHISYVTEFDTFEFLDSGRENPEEYYRRMLEFIIFVRP